MTKFLERRREFIGLVGCLAIAGSPEAHGQQPSATAVGDRRPGWLIATQQTDAVRVRGPVADDDHMRLRRLYSQQLLNEHRRPTSWYRANTYSFSPASRVAIHSGVRSRQA